MEIDFTIKERLIIMITKLSIFRSANYLFELRKDTWIDNWNTRLEGHRYLNIAARQNYKMYYDL